MIQPSYSLANKTPVVTEEGVEWNPDMGGEQRENSLPVPETELVNHPVAS